MAKRLTSATLRLFEDNCCDVKYLDMWAESPLTFTRGEQVGGGWHHDHHQRIVAHDSQGGLFEYGVDQLMRYHFYPSHIMSHVSHFSLDERWAQVGDRIAQRIHLGRLGRLPLLDVITMTEITAVVASPRRYGFTYTTVATHAEQGEWSVELRWLDNHDIQLTMQAHSRPAPTEPKRNYPFMRFYQKRAHQAGLSHFEQLLSNYDWALQPA